MFQDVVRVTEKCFQGSWLIILTQKALDFAWVQCLSLWLKSSGAFHPCHTNMTASLPGSASPFLADGFHATFFPIIRATPPWALLAAFLLLPWFHLSLLFCTHLCSSSPQSLPLPQWQGQMTIDSTHQGAFCRALGLNLNVPVSESDYVRSHLCPIMKVPWVEEGSRNKYFKAKRIFSSTLFLKKG